MIRGMLTRPAGAGRSGQLRSAVIVATTGDTAATVDWMLVR